MLAPSLLLSGLWPHRLLQPAVVTAVAAAKNLLARTFRLLLLLLGRFCCPFISLIPFRFPLHAYVFEVL